MLESIYSSVYDLVLYFKETHVSMNLCIKHLSKKNKKFCAKYLQGKTNINQGRENVLQRWSYYIYQQIFYKTVCYIPPSLSST